MILARVLPAVGQGHVDHVPRDRDHRHGLGDRVERGHDHRVRAVGVAVRRGVDADDQDVDPWHGGGRARCGRRRCARGSRGRRHEEARIGLGLRGRTDRHRRCLHEDLVEGLAGHLGRVSGEHLRDDDHDQQQGDDRARGPRVEGSAARAEQARCHREQAPDEQQPLDREERPDDLGCQGGSRDESHGRCRRDDEHEGAERDDDRAQEQERPPAPTGQQVAETGEERVEEGGQIP